MGKKVGFFTTFEILLENHADTISNTIQNYVTQDLPKI